MTAATITTRIDVNDPTKEVVILTATNEETYVSRKFGTVTAVQATFNEDMLTLTYPASVAVSGATVTFYCDGVTDKLLCLTLYGRK